MSLATKIQPEFLPHRLGKTTEKFTRRNCIDFALAKMGKTREEILEEVKEEKKLENKIMKMHEEGRCNSFIAKTLGIKHNKVRHVVKFDKLGLSYRKVGKRSKN